MNNDASANYYQLKWALNQWEVQETKRIRQNVFCQEQQVFENNDKDDIDAISQPLIATTSIAGMAEKAVGTVRIHQATPGVWWGSRLAVDSHFRRQGILGASLIKLAVSSANTLGCESFFAHVQIQNEVLFKKLHWRTQGHTEIHGIKHAHMQADLHYYPPLVNPQSGFWIKGRPGKRQMFNDFLADLCWGGKLHAAH